jgi:peptidyl-prolyl cis-trans isomerase-like 4
LFFQSVLFETSLGDIIVDLETIKCPTVSLNFLKLCKSYYYNFCLFHNVIPNFIAQTGDPTGNGGGGNSIWYNLPKNSLDFQSEPFFKPPRKELGISTRLKHDSIGTLSMAMSQTSQQEGGDGIGGIGSQFFFTLGNNENENLDYLDNKHVVFGKVIEGYETLTKINQSLLDQQGKPLRDIRIRHVIVLDDPFPDPQGLNIPPNSPVPTRQQLESMRVGEDEDLENEQEDPETFEKKKREHEAKAQALTLEMVGDLPFADVAPPENVLFVCKLNQMTSSEDLELIFSRFGEILSCEIIRDSKTGDSLQYAFIEFKERESAEKAYVKMDNVLVDDRRIHVDFSQSVSKLHNSWVFDKTGGRPPPNKHHTGRRGGDDGDSGLVFDMEEIDTRNSRNNNTTTTSRRDRDRRGDHRQHERGGSDSKRRNYERERSPRGGANRDRDRRR